MNRNLPTLQPALAGTLALIALLAPLSAWAHPGHGLGVPHGPLHALSALVLVLALVGVCWFASRWSGNGRGQKPDRHSQRRD